MSELAIAHLSNVDAILGGVIRAFGPSVVQLQPDCAPFQTLAQAIAHQQLNGTAANTILGRFVTTCGAGAFPTPELVLAAPEATLRAAGFSFAKIASLRDLAEKTLSGVVPDHATLHTLSDEEIITRLTEVRGIGRWTVEMMLMFRLGRPDILPVDDFGVRNGFRLAYGLKQMPAPKALAIFGERWGPYRSTAAWYMWRAVEMSRAGTLPKPEERIRLPRLPRKRRRAAAAASASATRRGAKAPRSARSRAARRATPTATARAARRTESPRAKPRGRPSRLKKAQSKRVRR